VLVHCLDAPQGNQASLVGQQIGTARMYSFTVSIVPYPEDLDHPWRLVASLMVEVVLLPTSEILSPWESDSGKGDIFPAGD
jgi:hypothetical protein